MFTLEGTLTASIAGGAVTDAFGNPGTAFSATYQVDIGVVPYPVPLAAENPLGSLIYDPTISGTVNFAGDADGFTLTLDPGQTLSVLVRPNGAGLRPTVEIRDSLNNLIASHTAAAAGQNALIQTVAVSGGTYTITVLGADSTTGAYTVQAVLNAALEEEGLLVGASNNTVGTAQNPGGSFLSLNTGAGSFDRGGVSGVTDNAGYFAAAVPFTFEDISTTGTVIAGLTNQDDASVSIPIGFTFPFYRDEQHLGLRQQQRPADLRHREQPFTNANLTTTPAQAIDRAFWDDLHTGGGTADLAGALPGVGRRLGSAPDDPVEQHPLLQRRNGGGHPDLPGAALSRWSDPVQLPGSGERNRGGQQRRERHGGRQGGGDAGSEPAVVGLQQRPQCLRRHRAEHAHQPAEPHCRTSMPST